MLIALQIIIFLLLPFFIIASISPFIFGEVSALFFSSNYCYLFINYFFLLTLCLLSILLFMHIGRTLYVPLVSAHILIDSFLFCLRSFDSNYFVSYYIQYTSMYFIMSIFLSLMDWFCSLTSINWHDIVCYRTEASLNVPHVEFSFSFSSFYLFLTQ